MTVYIAQAGEHGPVKIGFCKGWPDKRLKELQTGCPEPLALVRTFNKDIEYERELHALFGQYRKQGEWFEAVPQIMRFQGTLMQKDRRPLTPQECWFLYHELWTNLMSRPFPDNHHVTEALAFLQVQANDMGQVGFSPGFFKSLGLNDGFVLDGIRQLRDMGIIDAIVTRQWVEAQLVKHAP